MRGHISKLPITINESHMCDYRYTRSSLACEQIDTPILKSLPIAHIVSTGLTLFLPIRKWAETPELLNNFLNCFEECKPKQFWWKKKTWQH